MHQTTNLACLTASQGIAPAAPRLSQGEQSWLSLAPLLRARSWVAATLALVPLLLAAPKVGATPRAYSLKDCLELARQSNTHSQLAKSNVEAAKEVRNAEFTRYFPKVVAGAVGVVGADPLAQFSTSSGNLPVYNGNPGTLRTATQFAYLPSSTMGVGRTAGTVGLTAMQTVFAGGRILGANQLASVGVEAAELQQERAAKDIDSQTEQKYWRLVTLRQKLVTMTAYEALLEALLNQVNHGHKEGVLTNNDVLKVQLRKSQTAIDRLRLESGVSVASRDLRRHLSLTEGSTLDIDDRVPSPADPTSLRRLAGAAEKDRVEVKLLERATRAGEIRTNIARGAMYPTVAVGGAVYWTGLDGMPSSNNEVLFATLTWGITAAWEASHRAAAEERKAESARMRLADTRRLVRVDVEKSWDDLWAAWKTVAFSELAVKQAETNVTEVTDRYQNGALLFSDVLEAQVLRQQALEKRIEASTEYWRQRSAYLRAAGQPALTRN